MKKWINIGLILLCLSVSSIGNLHAQTQVGPVQIVYNGGPELCNSMIITSDAGLQRKVTAWNIGVPKSGKVITGETWSTEAEVELPPESGRVSKSKFDVDNDGVSEEVYGFHLRVDSDNSDTYFFGVNEEITLGYQNWRQKLLMPMTEAIDPLPLLIEKSKFRFPNIKMKEGGEPSQTDRNLFSYDTRYLTAKPFLWKGSTYFIMKHYGEREIQAVIKLNSQQQSEEVCRFKFKKTCLTQGFNDNWCHIMH